MPLYSSDVSGMEVVMTAGDVCNVRRSSEVVVTAMVVVLQVVDVVVTLWWWKW